MPASRPLTVAVIVAIIGALALAGVALATRSSGPDTLELRIPETATAAPTDGQLKVYVAGAVQRPGVYPFRPGDRVADAVEAAGGPADDADTLSVNLARRLRDEDHIVVPRRGEPSAGPAAGSPLDRRVDINTATVAALDALPGVGPTRAQQIIESRTKEGRFADTSELVKRKILPQSVYDRIKDLIDVR